MKEKFLKHKSKIILIGIILILVLLYLFNSSINQSVNNIFTMFATGDFKVVRDFIDEYGTYAMLVSAGLMVFQSVIAPLPAFLITFANANLFGWWQGAILSWSSAMLGACVCFYISRILGRDVVEKLTSKAGLESIDAFFERYGKHSILIARLLPFISFDSCKLCSRSYIYGLHTIFYSNRYRPIASHHSLFICWWYANRRSTIISNWTSYIICTGNTYHANKEYILFKRS